MTHTVKLYCPKCEKSYLTELLTVDKPKDLDGPPCQVCGTITELDTTQESKFSIYTKKHDKHAHASAVNMHKHDVLKSGKGRQGYQEASD